MYPSFVTFVRSEPDGTKVLRICDQEFKVFTYDWYIEDAINLVKHWKPHQIIYRRIIHLRTWIRENYQHGHEIPYKHIRSLQGCRHWVECIIYAEYANMGEEYTQRRDSALEVNRNIFSLNSS